jgi:arylformamidase
MKLKEKTVFKILSHYIDDFTPTYNNANSVSIIKNTNIPRSLKITLNNHTSTHIDLPAHFCKNGKNLNDFDENFWFFEKIGFLKSNLNDLVEKFDTLPNTIEILLLKTGFEKFRGTKKYIFDQPLFPKNLAYILKEKFPNLRVFGFDMISLSSLKNRELGRIYHKEFLCENEILLLEDMKLSVLEKTPEFLIIAPLLISEADAIPVFVYAKV